MQSKNLLQCSALIILQCLFAPTLFAQAPPPKQWDKRFGGSEFDRLTSLQQTTDGGYILGGYSGSGIGGDKTQDNWDQGPYLTADYWVVKTDDNGVKQWDKRFGGTDEDVLNSLQQTTDGGYILGGYSASGIGGDKTEGTRGYYFPDYWVVKIDANGIKQWDKRFGGYNGQALYSLQQTSDGGYILGGNSSSGVGGDKTEDNRGYTDYWIVKIDANGIKKWDKRFGGSDYDYLYALQQTSDGGYILGGYSYSGIGGDKTEDSRGSTDYWIVKTDSNGVKQWDKRFGGRNYDYLYALRQTSDGGYIVGGWTRSKISGDKTDDSRGWQDYWIVKIDANGIKQWDKDFGGSNDDRLFSLQQTMDSGYILGGSSRSNISGDKTEDSRGVEDYWIVKIDAGGIKQWDKRLGGSDFDYLKCLRQTADGGYIMGGYSFSGIGGDKAQRSRGSYDFWVVKIGCPPSATLRTSGSLDICQTGSVILKETSADTLKYQWLQNGKEIAGATQKVYTATSPGVYTVRVYSSLHCTNLSNRATVVNSCEPFANTSINVSPNPSNGIVTVRYTCKAIADIELSVYDKEGRIMFAQKTQAVPGNNSYELNLYTLTPGLYHLQLNNGGENNKAKFAIEK
jgi:hypothetical protein